MKGVHGFKTEVLVVGAGAAGLMLARELAKAGKTVTVLEARSRVGGRIFPLDQSAFGYPAQGGAEFVHGAARVTRSIIKEAGLSFAPAEGEVWSVRDGDLSRQKQWIQTNRSLKQRLHALKEDMSVAEFLNRNFAGKHHERLRTSVTRMVQGYDAADPKRMSALQLRQEWGADGKREDGRIKEGYGALLDFIVADCKERGATIHLNKRVCCVGLQTGSVLVRTLEGDTYHAEKAVVTAPLPVLRDIKFTPSFSRQLKAATEIGFGNVIKLVIRFKTRWWEGRGGKDLSKMSFLLSNEPFMTWWTQYPEVNAVLAGWMAGPEATKQRRKSSQVLLEMGLASLCNIFKVSKNFLRDQSLFSQVVNWSTERFSRGAYSYPTVHSNAAYKTLAAPAKNKLLLAGEALYSGPEMATVEGAFRNGLEVANRILGRRAS